MVHMPRYALSGGLLRQVAKGLVPVLPRPARPSPRAAARSPIPAFHRKPFAAPPRAAETGLHQRKLFQLQPQERNAMSPEDFDRIARKRAGAKLGFYIHAFVFVAVNRKEALAVSRIYADLFRQM
jgi:hypothetical protein